MSAYTRLTVAGSIRRAEVVVSSDEPLGAVLPRLLDLLGETGGTVARPLTLVASDGERLDVGRSPQQLDLGDGALLQLVRLDAAPPPPVVIDVTDAAADAHAARPDRWNDRARAIAGGVGIALAAGAAGFITPYGGAITAAWVLLIAFVALLSIATLLGLLRLPGVSACVSAAAAGVIVPLGVASLTASGAGGFGPASSALLGGAVLVAAGSSVVLLGLGVGLRRPGAAAGGAVGAVLASILLVLLLVGVGAEASAAIVGTIAAFATGPLPWIALSAAGLTRLDQGVAAGERLERPRAFASIDDAYSALTWSVGTVSAVLAVSCVALVLASELWSGLLALALGLVAGLRSRAFPLRVQVWSLWAAVAAIAATAVLTQLTNSLAWIGTGVSALTAVLIAIAVLARPAAHVRARLRGVGNLIETLAVVALLPLLLGALGIYGELLSMFGGGS